MRRLTVTSAGLALAALAACGGDNAENSGVAPRTACGARGAWDDGATETERYRRDERGRLLDAEVRDAAGAVVRRETWQWDGKLLRQHERIEGEARARTLYDYEFDRLLRVTREVDGGGQVTTYGYAGDAMVTQDVESRDPGRDSRHATITGDQTDRTTIVDCAVTGPDQCQTWVFEQPDRIPEHWTRASLDLSSDGTIDVRYERTLDARGNELTFLETAADGQGNLTVLARETTTRDPDGVELGHVREVFDAGARRVYRYDADFTCGAKTQGRVVEGGPPPAAAPRRAARDRSAIDDDSLAPRLLRRDLAIDPAAVVDDLPPRRPLEPVRLPPPPRRPQRPATV